MPICQNKTSPSPVRHKPHSYGQCKERLIYITKKTGRKPEKQEKGREDGNKLGRRNFRA